MAVASDVLVSITTGVGVISAITVFSGGSENIGVGDMTGVIVSVGSGVGVSSSVAVGSIGTSVGVIVGSTVGETAGVGEDCGRAVGVALCLLLPETPLNGPTDHFTVFATHGCVIGFFVSTTVGVTVLILTTSPLFATGMVAVAVT